MRFFLLQYASLLRPPITDSSAPGAEMIDKMEWKQVRFKFHRINTREKNSRSQFLQRQ